MTSDKGDLIVANRILDKNYTTHEQWLKDVDVSLANDLIEGWTDVSGYYYAPTDKYIDLMDALKIGQ